MLRPVGWLLTLLALATPAMSVARTTIEAPFVTCTPAYQTVSVGDTARFYAISNIEGSFSWVVEGEYLVWDAGPEFYANIPEPGEHRVAVVQGDERSYCTVFVGGGYGVGGYSGDFYGGSPLNVTLSSVTYPSWPNAGLKPQTFATLAFAVVLLLGVGIAFYPHARKAFAIVTR